MHINKGIIVLGGHVQALGIIRILGKENIPAIIIDNSKKNIARHSVYCKAFFMIEDNNLLDFLFSLGKDGSYKNWVIFPTNDYHVKILSLNKTTLNDFFIISTDYWSSTGVFYNKKLTYNLAENLNIPIPKTFFPSSEIDLVNSFVGFPCIIKPAIMHDFYRQTKKKVFLCNSYEELVSNYRKALLYIPFDEIIIQEVIKGSGRNQFSACFLILNDMIYVKLTACRMRQHPLDFGNATTYAETRDMPDLLEIGGRLLRAVNYNGLCEVEFKLDDKDGIFKLLEVNTRTWKWHSIAIKTLSPFLNLFYKHLTGSIIEPVTTYKNASFRHSLTDLPVQLLLILRGDRHWSRLKKPVQNAVWSMDDLMPWVFEKLYLFNLLNKRW